MSGTRVIEAIREATPGEVCANEFEIGPGDFIPCGDAAEVLFRITANGAVEDALLCAYCGEPLKMVIAGQTGGDAILP